MSEAAAAPTGGMRPSSAVWTGLAGGALAFVLTTAVGVLIGMIEYAASGRAYRLWTWTKVGFLYVASFCTVSLRVDAVGFGGTAQLRYRLPLLLGTAGALWLLARVGGAIVRRSEGTGATAAGLAIAALAFAVPVFLISTVAVLRFPGLLRFDVRPVLWQAALYPLLVACAGLGMGAFAAARPRLPTRFVAAVEGGGRAFVFALLFAFIGFLLAAAVKPAAVSAYARELRDDGRVGVLTGTHHILALPAQAVWILAPSMGGATELSLGPGDASRVTVGGPPGGWGYVASFDALRSSPYGAPGVTPWAFLLVPLAACVLGGRLASRRLSSSEGRAAVGAGAGVVFAVLVGIGAWASNASFPVPAHGWGYVALSASMPSTLLLALAWGVGGGVLGALTAGVGAQTPEPD